MAAQFELSWDNTNIQSSGNVTGQIVSYRKKLTGGAFITTGFDPVNPLDKTVNTVLSPNTLDYNCIYEFIVQTQCGVNGPTLNSNGIIEQIVFQCLSGGRVIKETFDVKARLKLDVTGLNITRARIALKRQSDDLPMLVATYINPIGNFISKEVIGLVAETDYYWEYELCSTINGVEVISSSVDYLSNVCNEPITTMATTDCPAPESLTVTQS